MSNKVICDICGKREASRQFKIRKRETRMNWGKLQRWGDWKEIDICGECGEKLLGLPYRDSEGFGRPPLPRKSNVEEAVIMPHSEGNEVTENG